MGLLAMLAEAAGAPFTASPAWWLILVVLLAIFGSVTIAAGGVVLLILWRREGKGSPRIPPPS